MILPRSPDHKVWITSTSGVHLNHHLVPERRGDLAHRRWTRLAPSGCPLKTVSQEGSPREIQELNLWIEEWSSPECEDIYEVIEHAASEAASDDDSCDWFDTSDSEEPMEYRNESAVPCSSKDCDRNAPAYGLNRLAVSASERIKKFWSFTKADIKNELNRSFGRVCTTPRAQEKSKLLYSGSDKFSTWSIKQRLRKISLPSSSRKSSVETKSVASTFYLPLNAAGDDPGKPAFVSGSCERRRSRRFDRRLSKSSVTRPTAPPPAPPQLPSIPAMASKESDENAFVERATNDKSSLMAELSDEPLYQFYETDAAEAAEEEEDAGMDGYYESIGENPSGAKVSALDVVSGNVSQKKLWCELAAVRESGVLEKLSAEERKCQEAIFEVIGSEASYLKSLSILVRHFMLSPELEAVLTKQQARTLFADIIPIKRTSEAFLSDLEKRWHYNVVIKDISDILLVHATRRFDAYVKYCSNQVYRDWLMRDLRASPRFLDVLGRLESDPVCQNLPMHSFLLLPMQRVTRLPLLVDAIYNRVDPDSAAFQGYQSALLALNKVVQKCNEAALKVTRMEEMLTVSLKLDFGRLKRIELVSASRYLVRKGELTRVMGKGGDTVCRRGRRASRQSLFLFLFNDILVVTEPKSGGSAKQDFLVVDHCARNMVTLKEEQDTAGERFLKLVLLENKDHKTGEMRLDMPPESEVTRWMEALTPQTSSNPDEKIYETWDCPQMKALHAYAAQQSDELSLQPGDVVNVLRKMADGWCQGEKMADGSIGWFPGVFCKEVASAHVRARNLRQRHRLLQLSESYIGEYLRKEGKKK